MAAQLWGRFVMRMSKKILKTAFIKMGLRPDLFDLDSTDMFVQLISITGIDFILYHVALISGS